MQDDYNTEELLRFLKSEKKRKLHKNNRVKKFIEAMGIKTNDDGFIPNYLIYYYFHLWNKEEKIKRVHFFKMFRAEFDGVHRRRVR